MRVLAIIFAFVIIFVCDVENSFAQLPDRNAFQQIYDGCNVEKSKLDQKVADMRYKEDIILKEYTRGALCVDCNRSATEIWDQEHEDLATHLAHTPHKSVYYPSAAQIENKKNTLKNAIRTAENEANSKNSECSQMLNDYNKEYAAAQEQTRQEAIDKQNAQIQVQQQAQQQAYQQAQQQRQQQLQRILDQQRQQQERFQQQQAQVNANQVKLNSNLDQINAQTQAKLQDAQGNSTLDNTQSDEVKNSAQSIDQSTSIQNLRQQVMGNDNTFLSAPDSNNDSQANGPLDVMKDFITDKVQDMVKDKFIEQSEVLQVLDDGLQKVQSIQNQISTVTTAFKGMMSGDFNKAQLDLGMSPYSNSIPGKIDKAAGEAIIDNGDHAVQLMNSFGGSEEEINKAYDNVKPLGDLSNLQIHFTPSKPWTGRDVAKAGAVVLVIAAFPPSWLGIGAAALYGFTH